MDKCFCHLNGYAVKDATARKNIETLQAQTNGNQSMGDIKVSSIRSKNIFNSRYSGEFANNNIVTKDGITITMISDGVIHIKGTATKTTYFNLYEVGSNNQSLVEYREKPVSYDSCDGIFIIGYFREDGTSVNRISSGSMIPNDAYLMRPYLVISEGTTIDKTYSLQLEIGTSVTDFAPHFELLTKENINNATGTSESVKGYYYYEISTQKLLFGLNGKYDNEITDADIQNVVKEIIEKIKKDEVRNPNIILANTLDSYVDNETGETVEKPSPRQIILNSLYHFTSDGIDHYSFEGIADYHGIVGIEDYNLPVLNDISFDVEGTWNGDTFTLLSLTIGGAMVYLATKKYVDDMLGGSTGGSSEIPYLYVSTVGISTSNSVTLTSDELATASEYITNSINKICEVAVKCNGATPGVLHSEEPLTGTETKIYLYGVNTTNSGSVVHNYKLSLQGSWSDGVFTATYGTVSRYVNIQKSDFLAKNNTTSFTPTADYHPVTKKYVDDAIADLRAELSGQ